MKYVDDSNSEFDGTSMMTRVREYLSLILRGKWIILLTILIGAALAFYFTQKAKKVYEATAIILIKTKTHASGNLPFIDLTGGESKISNELGILKSRLMAQHVARAIVADPFLNAKKDKVLPIAQANPLDEYDLALISVEKLAGKVRGAMSFSPEPSSDMIRITARSSEPREAAILANLYAEAYLDENLNASRARSKSLREFLQAQLNDQRLSLQRIEDSLRHYMETTGIVSMDEESNKIVQQMSQLEASRNALDLEINTLQQRLQSYQREFPEQEASVARTLSQSSDAYIKDLKDQLGKLEAQRDLIAIQNDPAVLGEELYAQRLREIDDRIAGLRKQLLTRTEEMVKSLALEGVSETQTDPLGYLRQLKQTIFDTKLQLEIMGSKRLALDNLLQQTERKFRRIPSQSIEIAELQRARASRAKVFALLEEKYNEAVIAERSEFGYVDIVDRAVVPGSPVSPDRTRNLLLGILLGGVVGLGVIVLRDMLDVRVRTPEDLRKRGFVSLTEIAPMEPELKRMKSNGKLPEEARRFDEHLRLVFSPLSFLAESFRRLRTAILHAFVGREHSAIIVSSANPAEGKSTLACNLAISFAETQHRVLLIDADLRRPMIHTYFGLQPRPGLTDVLAGKSSREEAIRQGVVENLDVMCHGALLQNPSKAVASVDMRDLIKQLKEVYAWVIIDTPPVLVMNDAAALASAVDGILLVAASGTTRLATLERAVEFLEDAGGSILGIVLNRFNARKAYGPFFGSHTYGHYGPGYSYYSHSNGKGKEKPAGVS